MTEERQQQIERICQEALDRHVSARGEYLASACLGDDDLRREVESLLTYEPAAERFIEAPAIEHVARELAAAGTLRAGVRLGAYEVLSPLGSGGMGDVYRARDTTLRREVAIKVLPALFLSDPARRARFEQEARMLAALNHPHIASIYGADDSSGVPALVLELVEGETLATLLARSGRGRPAGLSQQKALDIARQIADALEAAHDKGIIHRDLKPSNIKVTPNGVVKVLDFGVATAFVDDTAEREQSDSADASSPGVIVGTAAYMSPEQAQGLPIDKRTDIWAFGCVLFEMLSGRRAFEGDGGPATLTNVVAREPDWAALPEETPSSISRLLRRCLQKDRRQRLADVADARLEIDEALSTPVDDLRSGRPSLRARERVAWSTAAACLIALGAAVVIWMRADQPESRLVQFSITVPGMADSFVISLSPDGNRLAYSASTGSGQTALWVRSLSSPRAELIPGTQGAIQADWSPDSRFLLFSVDGRLKKVDVMGGLPQTLTTIRGPVRRTTWNRDGVILFADDPVIRRVADTGGEATAVTELDTALEETNHSTPWFLPDGRHFLYTAWSNNPDHRAIYVGSLDSQKRMRLMSADSKAIYSPLGFILFRQGERLMAQPFDAKRLRLTGEAHPIVESVDYNPALGQSAFSVSTQGTLAYVAGATTDLRLSWVDRTGRPVVTRSALPRGLNPVLSPDGKRFTFYDGATPDIWTYDFESAQTARLSRDPASDRFPIFSSDGLRLVFASNRDNPEMSGLYEKPSNGAGAERRILPPTAGNVMIPRAWTDDGTQIIFETGQGFGQQRDIWILNLASDRKAYPYVATSFDERHPALAPRGHWLAYVSNESGSYQVIVQAFPDPSAEKIPIGLGMFPRWKGDGSELYYMNPNGKIVAASVRKTASTFEVTRTTELFEAPFSPGLTDLNIPYDVTSDGKRFLMSAAMSPVSTAKETVINVVLEWSALLRGKRPAD